MRPEVYQGIEIGIPSRLNLGITALASAVSIGLLVAASRTDSGWLIAACAIVFSFSNNTIFSMLHEAVHKTAHANPRMNYFIGLWTAALFPTAYTFQKVCHLGHHRRNRTDHEHFDGYYASDSKFMKFFQLYAILLGGYWASIPFAVLVYLICPWALDNPLLRNRESQVVTNHGADAMLTDIFKLPWLRPRVEILFTIAVQASLFLVLGVTWKAWIICYLAFGINWGGLQYADHAWSVRDIRNGAWNLKINPLVRWVFLNYHHHLAHHQHPQVPWVHLQKFIVPGTPEPTFLSIYLELWKGPKLTNEPPPPFIDPELSKILEA